MFIVVFLCLCLNSTIDEKQHGLHPRLHDVFATTICRHNPLPWVYSAYAGPGVRTGNRLSTSSERRFSVLDLPGLLHCANQLMEYLQEIDRQQTFDYSYGYSDYLCVWCNECIPYPDAY